MDFLETARTVIRSTICEYAAVKPSYGDVEVEVVLDDESGHYELLYNGWDDWRRVHGCVIHIDIKDDKVLVQHDGTEEGIADRLVAGGIPSQSIVLAFKHPSARRHMDFAVA